MNRIVWCWIGAAFIGVIGSGYLQGFLQEPSNSASADPSQYSAVINRYCVVCHNEKLKTGDLILSKEDVTNPGANPEIWEKVVSKLRFRAMPPVPAPRPDEATYKSLVTYLEAALDRAAIANVNPGPLHRRPPPSTAPNTPMRSATCWGWRSMGEDSSSRRQFGRFR